MFPSGNQYLIKVVASDGFNTGQDASNTFTVKSSISGGDTSGDTAAFPTEILIVVGLVAVIAVVAVLVVFKLRKRGRTEVPPPPPPPP